MEKIVYKLPVFEGSLDALLYLISKNKLNIYDIPIAELYDQYMEYLASLREFDLDITSEFLDMASRLVQIKSAMLLPKSGEEEDPRQELVNALVEYKTCKAMAEALRQRSAGFDCFVRPPQPVEHDSTYRGTHACGELVQAYRLLGGRIKSRRPPPVSAFHAVVEKKLVSVTSRIVHIFRRLIRSGQAPFLSLFEDAAGRQEVVATFLAVLELIKAKRVVVTPPEEGEIVRMVRVKKRWK